MAAKYLERIADHCVMIADDLKILFLKKTDRKQISEDIN